MFFVILYEILRSGVPNCEVAGEQFLGKHAKSVCPPTYKIDIFNYFTEPVQRQFEAEFTTAGFDRRYENMIVTLQIRYVQYSQ